MRALKAIVGLLGSARVAVGLMVVVALLSLIGATIHQGGDRAFYVGAHGRLWGAVVWNLGLGDVFGSDYYTALLVLLCGMVLVCSLKGLPARMKAASRRDFVDDEEALKGMPCSASLILDVDAEEARLHVRDVLAKRLYSVGFRPIAVRQGGGPATAATAVAASKFGFSRYGSTLLHLSFIFLLAGGIAMTRLGSRQERVVPVGGAFALETGAGRVVKVAVEDFNVEFDRNNNVSDYVCDVALRDSAGVLSRHSVRPNHPLKYGGREIYLQSFARDDAAPRGFVLSVYDSTGALVVPHLVVALDEPTYVDELGGTVTATDGSVPRLRLALDGGRVETHLIRQHPGGRSDGRSGHRFVAVGAIPALMISLEVVREPGQGLAIAGLVLLTAGGFLSLYLSHRSVWFIVRPLPEGRASVSFGGRANRNREGFGAEFASLRRTLEELA